MKRLTVRFFHHNSGATAIEYTILAAVVSLAVVAGSGSITSALKAQFGVLNDALETTASEAPKGDTGFSEKSVVVEGVEK